MKPTYLFPLVLCLLLNMAVAETTVSVTAASQAATPTVSTQDLKTLELQFQEKMLDLREKNDKQADELREKTLNAWQNSVSIWLAIMSILGLAIPWVISTNAQREAKQIKEDMRQLYHTAKEDANKIKDLSQKQKNFNPNADNPNSQEQKDAIQAAEVLKDNREIPLAEQLRAHAIVLSAHAKSYAEHEQAFYAWQAVIQHSQNDVDSLFNAAYQAYEAYKQGSRLQKSAWFPYIEQGYQQVLVLAPDNYQAASNWGVALDNEARALAQNNRLDEAWGKWNEAYTQYNKALRIKPDFYLVAYNWGLALNSEARALAQNNRLDEAWDKWHQAYKQYDKALRIKTDFYQAAYNWGNALDDEAQALVQNKRLDEAWKKWDEAYKLYNKALSIQPDYHQAAYNWGLALNHEAQALAQNKRLDETWKKWNQAYKQYNKALRIKTDFYQAANNWGSALDDEAQALAQNNRLNEAWDKWNQAYKQYNKALNIKPDYYQAASNCINSLIHTYHARKQNQQDQTAQAKLEEAKKLAEDFIQNYPQHAAYLAYNLACVYALLGNSVDKVVEQLKLSVSGGKLPSKSHIEQEKDFDGIRQSPAFQDWFKHTFPN